MPGTPSNGARPSPDVRALPQGLVLVGVLDYVGISPRNDRMLSFDVLVEWGDGRKRVQSATAWVSDQDGAMTQIGKDYADGKLRDLKGREVMAVVTARAAQGKLYITVVSVEPTVVVPAPSPVSSPVGA
jgi:hypothetical protein